MHTGGRGVTRTATGSLLEYGDSSAIMGNDDSQLNTFTAAVRYYLVRRMHRFAERWWCERRCERREEDVGGGWAVGKRWLVSGGLWMVACGWRVLPDACYLMPDACYLMLAT